MTGKLTTPLRRKFLRQAMLLSGGLALTPIAACAAAARKIQDVGLQLYTLRAETQVDFAGTLGRVAELGYKQIEFAGYYGNSPAQVRAMLDDSGLTSPASHIQMAALRDNLQGEIETAANIGQDYIIVPSLAAAERTLDHYHRHAEFLNHAGEACSQAGIEIGYHNHDYEFIEMNGQLPYDILLNETDSSLVGFELDLFWIVHAGRDPLGYFSRYPGRFPAVHVKDRAADGSMVDVGRGQIDFAEIFANSGTAGIKHYFVEHDSPDDGFDSVTYSINTIRNLTF